MKLFVAPVVMAVAATFMLPASAQFAKPEDAIKYRQSAMFVMQQNFARVAGMAAGKIPYDAKVAADSAAVAEYVSKLPWAGFVAGSDSGNTKAKDEIWTQRSKFDEVAGKMQSEMAKLAVAAKAGDMAAIKAAVSATGGVCKSCHDDFRKN